MDNVNGKRRSSEDIKITSHLVVVNVPVCGIIPDAEQAHQAVIRHLMINKLIMLILSNNVKLIFHC